MCSGDMSFQNLGDKVERNKDLVRFIQVVHFHEVWRRLLGNLKDMIHRYAGMDICRYISVSTFEVCYSSIIHRASSSLLKLSRCCYCNQRTTAVWILESASLNLEHKTITSLKVSHHHPAFAHSPNRPGEASHPQNNRHAIDRKSVV